MRARILEVFTGGPGTERKTLLSTGWWHAPVKLDRKAADSEREDEA